MPLGLEHYEYEISSRTTPYRFGQKSRTYPSRIINADVVISAFKLQFDHADRPVAEVMVNAEWIENINDDPQAAHVLFEVHANLADRNADDPYNGYVNVLLIVETE